LRMEISFVDFHVDFEATNAAILVLPPATG
jgi:hypothetical protein